MEQLFIPQGYHSVLDVWQTEQAIKFIKETFQSALASELKLRRITAPLFVKSGKGLNDNLSGTESPVSWEGKATGDSKSYWRWVGDKMFKLGGCCRTAA